MVQVRPGFKSLLFLALVAAMSVIMAGCASSNSVVSNRDTLLQEAQGTASPTANVPQNAAPVINLKASQSLVGYSGQVIFTADGMDPDGDPLKFSWTASEGVFVNQTGSQATWKAPDKVVSAEIKCQAEDPKGAKNSAKAQVDVVGGRKYHLNIAINRTSLYSNSVTDSQTAEWIPLSQGKVTLPAINQVGVSDMMGNVELEIDSGVQLASQSEVWVQYLDWEAKYTVVFPASGKSISDSIQFYPGYDGISIAVARGDSFQTLRGGVEVMVEEQTTAEYRRMSEVTVQVGTGQQVAQNGVAFLSSELPGSEATLKVSKAGYQPLSGYKIPVFVDGLTIVRARMIADSGTPRTEAIVSWSRPYKEQKAVAVNGPFEIGFGQPMEKASIFNDLEMVIQEAESRSTIILNGADVANRFTVQWDGDTLLRLTPKNPLQPLKKYSFSVTRWTAHALDGRILKNYGGMFGAFTTDTDAKPAISSTSPKNGDSGFPRAGPFVIRFDRAMDPTTLPDGLLVEITNVNSGSSVRIDGSSLDSSFTVQWREDNTLLSLTPKTDLLANTPYLVKLLKSGLRSTTGRGIDMLSNLWGQFSTGEL